MSDTDLVVIRQCVNESEAEVVKTALDAAGIDSMIRSDFGGLRLSLQHRGVELLVKAEDAETAEEILRAAPEP